jgi:hypothetical protein
MLYLLITCLAPHVRSQDGYEPDMLVLQSFSCEASVLASIKYVCGVALGLRTSHE